MSSIIRRRSGVVFSSFIETSCLTGGKTTIVSPARLHTKHNAELDAERTPRAPLPRSGLVLGLLEVIPEAGILAHADPDDRDGDGISGRPYLIAAKAGPRLGRFGLKAGAATLRAQAAAAFSRDLGLSTALHPAGWGECISRQASCRSWPDGGDGAAEVAPEALDLLTFYVQNIAVPARRDPVAANVLDGKRLFYASGCPACHVPKFVTARLASQPQQSFQLIWPYSDLLLHEMGPGLADNRPEALASGTGWRTAPLWGIGVAV